MFCGKFSSQVKKFHGNAPKQSLTIFFFCMASPPFTLYGIATYDDDVIRISWSVCQEGEIAPCKYFPLHNSLDGLNESLLSKVPV